MTPKTPRGWRMVSQSMPGAMSSRASPIMRVGMPQADAEQVESLSGPFGNSTNQNKVSGSIKTDVISRPGDRLP